MLTNYVRVLSKNYLNYSEVLGYPVKKTFLPGKTDTTPKTCGHVKQALPNINA